MPAALLIVCLLGATLAPAQSDPLEQRVRLALAGTGTADGAASMLANRDYRGVDALLAAAPAPDEKSRAGLISLRGAIAFLQQDMAAAVQNFENAERLAPLADGDAFTEAMALVSLGARDRARPILEGLTQRHKNQPIYIYWLGRLDFDQHRYEQAEAQLQAALKLDPASARAWDSLGLTLDMEGKMDDARAAFEKAAALNRLQTHPSPWPPHDLGYLLLRMNCLPQAETVLRESLRYDEAFPQAHYHLGRTLQKEGRDSEALPEYLKAIKQDPASSDACYSLALLYRRLHRDSEASAMFTEYERRRRAQP